MRPNILITLFVHRHLLQSERDTTPSVTWTSGDRSDEPAGQMEAKDLGLFGLDHWNAGAREGYEGMGRLPGHHMSGKPTMDAYQSGIQEVGGQGLSQQYAVFS